MENFNAFSETMPVFVQLSRLDESQYYTLSRRIDRLAGEIEYADAFFDFTNGKIANLVLMSYLSEKPKSCLLTSVPSRIDNSSLESCLIQTASVLRRAGYRYIFALPKDFSFLQHTLAGFKLLDTVYYDDIKSLADILMNEILASGRMMLARVVAKNLSNRQNYRSALDELIASNTVKLLHQQPFALVPDSLLFIYQG